MAKKAKKKAKKKTSKSPSDRLIQCYGLFWRWEDVHTGGGKRNKGALWGYRKGAKKKHVDFREQRGIYALYAGHDFVYAGQIDKRGLLTRLKEHCNDDLAERWDRFSFFGTRRVLDSNKIGKIKVSATAKTNVAINQLETFLIHVSAPALNNNRGKWSGATRYYQVRDKRLGPTHEEMVADLHKEMLKRSKKKKKP